MGKLNRSKTQTLTANYTIACMYRDGDLTPNESSPSPPPSSSQEEGDQEEDQQAVSSSHHLHRQLRSAMRTGNAAMMLLAADHNFCSPCRSFTATAFSTPVIPSIPSYPILSHLIPSHQQPTESPPNVFQYRAARNIDAAHL